MNRTLLAVCGVCFLAGWALAQQPGEAFAPKDGKFTVRFPGKPKETPQTAKSALGDLKVFTATYATADGNAYLASYTDFPPGTAKPENRNTLLDGVRDGLKGKDGEILADNEIELGKDKLPAREYEVKKGKQVIRFRVVLRDDRLYQVAVVGTADFVSGKEAKGFLESFALTK